MTTCAGYCNFRFHEQVGSLIKENSKTIIIHQLPQNPSSFKELAETLILLAYVYYFIASIYWQLSGSELIIASR